MTKKAKQLKDPQREIVFRLQEYAAESSEWHRLSILRYIGRIAHQLQIDMSIQQREKSHE